MANNANTPSVIIPENATPEEKFEILYNLNLSDKIEKRENLSYLSWAHAVKLFKTYFPTGTYSIIKNPQTGLPYFNDPSIGIIVMTEVTIDGISQCMWLPVMDNKHKTMKEQAYTYQVWDNYSKQYVEKTVNAASMMDINTALQRCLTKNIAVCTGIGLSLYTNEDLNDMDNQPMQNPVQNQQPTPQKRTYNKRTTSTTQQPQTPAPQPQQSQYDPYTGIKAELSQATDMTKLMALYQKYRTLVDTDATVKSLFTQARINLTKAA